MGVEPPVNGYGRVLAEGLVRPPKNVAPRKQKIKEIDCALLDVRNAIAELKEKARPAGRGRDAADPVGDAERDYYRIERILEWNKFGTYDRLIRSPQTPAGAD